MQKKGWIVIAAIMVIAAGIMWYKHAQRRVARQGMGPAVTAPPEEEMQPQKASLFAADGTHCFAYSHAATADAPYAVEEWLTLTKSGGEITGEKHGTQAGPGMTNGYTGTITGTITQTDSGARIDADFAYTVEGAAQTEREIYQVSDTTLEKLRYELVDSDGILVPNLATTPSILSYTEAACQ